jgi:hypothetical protein
MEQTHELINAIVILHVNSDTSGVLPPSVLNHIGKFTEYVLVKDSKLKPITCSRTLHKIHTFVESQQSGSKVKQFFHQGEMGTLLKDCKNGLTQELNFFRVSSLTGFAATHTNNLFKKLTNTGIMTDISKMQVEAKQRYQEVLDMINRLSDTASSDRASTVW